MPEKSWMAMAGALALLLAACGGGGGSPAEEATTPAVEETTAPETTTTDEEIGEPEGGPVLIIEAPVASITVDGDPSDWEGISGLDLTLEAIEGEEVESLEATAKFAHDGEFVYVLFEVQDDYNWRADDAHLSGSAAVMWAIDPAAGEAMGAEEPDRDTSLGIVDIWHWELECALGIEGGGAVSGPGDKDPGNDAGCNFDDEWATTPEEREDDNGSGAENSLLGVWNHTNPTDDGEGTWIFELRRPLQTGDDQDAQLAAGETGAVALAYWDADFGPEGWEDTAHVQSSNQGWIEVTFAP